MRRLVLIAVLVAGPAVAHEGLAADIDRLARALAARPGDPALRLARAEAWRRAGEPHRALADLAGLDDPAAHRERGLAHAALGETERALAHLDAAIDAGAGTAHAHEARAQLHAAAGRITRAVLDYDAAIGLGPTPHRFLARGRLQEASGDLAAAAQGYREGLSTLGASEVLEVRLVEIEIRRGALEAALVLADEALARAPVKTEWLLRRAAIHAAAARASEARADRLAALAEANRVLALRRTSLGLVARARAHLALGRRDAARVDLEAATRAAPRYAEAHALLRALEPPHGALLPSRAAVVP